MQVRVLIYINLKKRRASIISEQKYNYQLYSEEVSSSSLIFKFVNEIAKEK